MDLLYSGNQRQGFLDLDIAPGGKACCLNN